MSGIFPARNGRSFVHFFLVIFFPVIVCFPVVVCFSGIVCFSLLGSKSFAQSSSAVPVRIIVVESETSAQQILKQLQSGADFAVIAKEKSIDVTAPEGGSMGMVDPASLRSELRDAIQSLAPGQISGVIQLPSSFAIVQVLSSAAASAQVPASAASSSSNVPGQSSSSLPSSTSSTSASSSSVPTQSLPLTARGSIRYLANVGGKGEADLAFRSYPKPEGWNQDLQALCKIRKDSMASVIDLLNQNLTSTDPDATNQTPLDVIQTRYALANLYAYLGQMDKSVDQWENAYQIAATNLPQALPELEEVLGTAYLHKSEMDNDVYRKPGDRCIFPPRAGMHYDKTESSEKAIEYLTKYLQQRPDRLDAKWVLNIAYMTLGKYPDGVPKEYLVPPSYFESAEDVGRFVDVAPQAGLNMYDMSGGLIVDDFDNDGLLDIVTSDFGQCAPMHFFHNNGDGTFSDRTAKAGLSDQLGGLNLIQTDYNNDGCLDILVLRGAWEFPQRKSLLRNNCDGTFTDVTAASGLAEPATDTQTAVWADIDNDGYLDLFVGNENAPSQLFHNNGNGTFTDIAHAAGVDRVGYSKAVVAADYDNDGYVDFYVANLDGDHFLYHNNHNSTFSEVALQAGVEKPRQTFPAWFFDYDNDGWPDLFVSSYYVSVDETLRSYLGLPSNAETLKVYKNLGNGTFRDVTSDLGLDRVFMPMGSNFGDIDNDGYLDFYLGTGNPAYSSLLPNVLFHNKDGKYFVDVTASSGTGELHKGHGVAFADIGNRGQEDLLEEVGGAVPGDSHAFRLFENPGNGNDWITLHLVGMKTNRAAIGARIKVTAQDAGQPPRSIYRTVGSGGSFGASPLQQHIGLGKSAKIQDIEIWWPASNTRQHFASVATNQFLEIKEFDKDYKKLERKSFRIGGPPKEVSSAQASAAQNNSAGK
jgi:tetratricopeptide (TPR) repeat protein